MMSLLVGIIVLVAVTLAISRSLVSDRPRETSDAAGKYDDAFDGASDPLTPEEVPRERAGKEADRMIDDFVLQDAVDDENLTGIWED